MKLTVLGGGGVRIPAFVRAVLADRPTTFDKIHLFEPDALRRSSTGRLAVELANTLGRPGAVETTADPEEALSGADFVFSAIRVGGDRGRIIDEEVALSRGLVGQETTGPGGCAMALRTIPVMLGYCAIIARVAPQAVLVNFTNPAGLITQALSIHGRVSVVGVCDTPSGTITRLGEFLSTPPEELKFSYGGLNHLGWISSLVVDGEERIGELVRRYEELAAFDHRFAAFDPQVVRRLGCIPTEYLYYYYDPARYVAGVASAGSTRGQDVSKLNSELLAGIARAFESGGVEEAWAVYSRLMGVRRDTYMRTDTEGDNGQQAARQRRSQQHVSIADSGIGGYEGVALKVIDGLSGQRPSGVVVNTANGASLSFLDPEDVVEVPALVDTAGISPLAGGELAPAARGLILQVKAYERAVVDAAVSGDGELAALALAMHPLVPGITVARELMNDYLERHGPDLAYLSTPGQR